MKDQLEKIMALRIGGGKPKLQQQDDPANTHAADEGDVAAAEASEPQAEEATETPQEESMEPQGGGLLDPMTAGYKTPDQGPFMCRNCIHYGVQGENTCEIVAGPIHEDGICNVFTSGAAAPEGDMPMEQETPQEEVAPQEENEASVTA